MIGKGKDTARISILVVDDDDDTRVLLERVLKSRGYEVSVAADGIEGLMEIARKTFDLIQCDVEMPNLNGVKLLEMKISQKINTPIVFLTAVSNPEVEVKCLKLGAADFLNKPVTKELLLSRVASILAKSR